MPISRNPGGIKLVITRLLDRQVSQTEEFLVFIRGLMRFEDWGSSIKVTVRAGSMAAMSKIMKIMPTLKRPRQRRYRRTKTYLTSSSSAP